MRTILLFCLNIERRMFTFTSTNRFNWGRYECRISSPICTLWNGRLFHFSTFHFFRMCHACAQWRSAVGYGANETIETVTTTVFQIVYERSFFKAT